VISGPRRSRTALAVAALLVVAACGLPQTGAPSSPDGSTPSAASLPPGERLISRIEVGPPPGPTKPFRGEVVHEIQIVDGYATARFVFRNIGEEPITWLNTLYDYEPMQLYQPLVRLEWTDGSQAFATRLGRFFPEPAILQPGEEAVYLMGGREVNGGGEIGDLVTHIKYCPTRGMDDVPGLPLEVSDLQWETIDGVTTVRGTIRETEGVRRGSSPTIGVALFDTDGAFVGAVVADTVGERMEPNSSRSFEISGRGVLGQIAVAAHGSAWVR
jgi:hypothetical protein